MTLLKNTLKMPDWSRRIFLAGAAASVCFATASCRTPAAQRSTDATDRGLIQLAQRSEVIARAEPDLPGLRLLERAEVLIDGFGRDAPLLRAALYLHARERLMSAGPPLSETGVRAALARPADPDRFGRPFLERTLAEARIRAAGDAGYAQALQVGGGGWRCIDEDGFEIFTSNLCLRLIRRGILIAVFAFL